MQPRQEQTIFLEAIEKDPSEVTAYLNEACAGDTQLLRGLETLLRLHTQAPDFLNVPALEQVTVASLGTEAAAAELSFLAPSSEPGSLGRLDHYEILEVIGRGGMGVVLRARDTKLERIVAIKSLAAPFATSGTARQRFAREARAAAAVRDEHVVAIYAVRDDAPVPYMVMEFIDGCNLETLLRRGGIFEAKEVLRIGLQITFGLAAAHQQGLIHRDIKPANILLENGIQRVKLTDFGLARAADDASLTQNGLIAGTPLYMAPEQASGEPIDTTTDLFSLGSVLYELCTGQPAFRAPTTVAVIRRVCDATPLAIREVNPDIPEGLCRVIEQLHAKKPADRPVSAREVAELLASLVAESQQPSSVARTVSGAVAGDVVTSVPRQPARWKHNPRTWVAAAIVLLVAGLGLSEATGVTDVPGTVIRLFSAEGTLVVEVDDPAISVLVEGGDVVITGAGTKELRLKPGQYKVEASKDGRVVRQELVSVTHNGREVVRISKDSVGHVAAVLDPWEKSVAELHPVKQVEAVVRRMKELNPRFDGNVEPTIQYGLVTGLRFVTDEVHDISPLHALNGLRMLDCSGTSPGKGKLADLTPLRGLRLTTLYCRNNPVANLSALRDMPLTSLGCRETQVSDLTPLKAMRLEAIDLNDTGVADLEVLRGMPLVALDLHGARKVSDLRPLKDMPLAYLNLTHLPVTDLSVLASLKKLRHLGLNDTLVTDLRPLRGLPLDILGIQGTRVTDLTPLEGMPIEALSLDYRHDHEKVLRSLPRVKVVNSEPADDFWKKVSEMK